MNQINKKLDINPTIKKLSETYQLPYELLLHEFIDSGDEYTALIKAIEKQALIKEVGDYIKTSSLENIAPIFHNILKNKLPLADYENNFFSTVINSDKNEVIQFTKFHLIAIIKLNDLNKPLIRGEEKEFVDEIINKIVHSDNFIIEMTKEEALKLYNIIKHYKLSFESMSEINNYYLLCDDVFEIVYQSNKNDTTDTTTDTTLSKSKDKTIKN